MENAQEQQQQRQHLVQVDVIIPVHNAASTIEDAVRSAMNQIIPEHLQTFLSTSKYHISIAVCCYDDRSTDDSWSILSKLKQEYSSKESTTTTVAAAAAETTTTTNNEDCQMNNNNSKITSKLLIGQDEDDGVGRGAGYARNRAIELNNSKLTIEQWKKEKILDDKVHNYYCKSDNDNDNKNGNNNDDKKKIPLLSFFLCLLDSDDTMHPHRIAEQTYHMLHLVPPSQRSICLLGCNFDRDPPDSTWHYSAWANSLSDERLLLERFREVTILQPTWFMCRSRWETLGGYVEAPLQVLPSSSSTNTTTTAAAAAEATTANTTTTADIGGKEQQVTTKNETNDQTDVAVATTTTSNTNGNYQRLIHPIYDDADSLKLAEDLRFFHEHLQAGGILRLHRTEHPLVTYRHSGTSQSFRTSRRLLQQLRVLALERSVLLQKNEWFQKNKTSNNDNNGHFVIWGAGRDGKDFVKFLGEEVRKRIYCFVDLDAKKLESGHYVNRELGVKIPIVHYSFLIRDPEIRQTVQQEWKEGLMNASFDGQIDKSRTDESKSSDVIIDSSPSAKKRKVSKPPRLNIRGLSQEMLETLPVIVCVAMNRTNGVLEKNVKLIGRVEGCDLWHFS